MITRRVVYLELLDGPVPDATLAIEREGFAVVPGAFSADEVAELRRDIERVYADVPADVRNPGLPENERDDFRYEMLNRSAVCQRAIGDRRILDVIEPLLGEDCHVIANTAWRNPPRERDAHGGGHWHIDAGPHVPRPAGVSWDDRIPYPVFAIGVHLMLQDCPLECGPTGAIAGSHRSGQHPPFDRLQDVDLEYDGNKVVPLLGQAGDLVLFASDVWHRRLPTCEGNSGRFFLQLHYGRRDIAQRLRPTRHANQLSPDTVRRAADGRARTVLGLHDPLFYDG